MIVLIVGLVFTCKQLPSTTMSLPGSTEKVAEEQKNELTPTPLPASILPANTSAFVMPPFMLWLATANAARIETAHRLEDHGGWSRVWGGYGASLNAMVTGA